MMLRRAARRVNLVVLRAGGCMMGVFTLTPFMNTTPLRRKDQIMGITLNESFVLNPDRVEASMRDLAASGFGIVRLFLRSTNFNHRSPEFIEAVRRGVAEGHKLGLKVAIDCEPHYQPVGIDMGRDFPGAMGQLLVRAETPVVDGRFHLRIPNPSSSAERAEFRGLAAVYLEADGKRRLLTDLKYDWMYQSETHFSSNYIFKEHYYQEGRPHSERKVNYLRGEVAQSGEGKLVVYAAFDDARLIDFWSPETWRYYDVLLDLYRDIPLDGVGWDEPAVGGDWASYRYGVGFAAAFERLNGYALAPELWKLDSGGMDAAAMKVRMDYYRTLNEGTFEAQRRLIAKARELFGQDILTGTHHTWQGEGGINDYRAGAVDYFRLNENMDAGYTDCSWWDPDSVNYAYTLGSSLGRLTPTGEAEVNTWHQQPTGALTEWNVRLMTLMDITWFNIWYGETSDTALYPSHYTWPRAVKEMQRHRDAQRLLGGAKPVVDVAMLHGWESVCGINRPGIAGAHKAFSLNTSTMMIERGVAFDWIDTGLLANSTIADGRLVNALGSYRVLVLPYASVLPRAAWDRAVELAQAGGTVIFTGTPPDQDTDGKSLVADFAALLDMPELPLDRYLAAIDAACTLPVGRPQQLDVIYPLRGDAKRITISVEDEPHAIRNAQGNVHYLTDLDPLTRLIDLIEPALMPAVRCASSSILWRLYRDGAREILVLVARKDRRLEGIVKFAGRTIEFNGGTVAHVVVEDGNVKVHGDDELYRIA
jgi:hypothetical protein